MALAHNIIIRGMNSIYLQSEYIKIDHAHDFLTYCQCWSEFVHNHHICEEVAYFPIIEKATGMVGVADTNVDQHEAFMGGLHEFDDYVYGVHPWQFSGARIVEILDTFAAKLQMHLTDEIVWILSLAQYPNLDLAGIDAQHGLFVKARSSLTRLLPFFMTNHDITYENSIHRWWPTNTPLRDFFLRYICTLVHRSAWQYSSCTFSGKPKNLVASERWRKKERARAAMVTPPLVEREDSNELTKPKKAACKSYALFPPVETNIYDGRTYSNNTNITFNMN